MSSSQTYMQIGEGTKSLSDIVGLQLLRCWRPDGFRDRNLANLDIGGRSILPAPCRVRVPTYVI